MMKIITSCMMYMTLMTLLSVAPPRLNAYGKGILIAKKRKSKKWRNRKRGDPFLQKNSRQNMFSLGPGVRLQIGAAVNSPAGARADATPAIIGGAIYFPVARNFIAGLSASYWNVSVPYFSTAVFTVGIPIDFHVPMGRTGSFTLGLRAEMTNLSTRTGSLYKENIDTSVWGIIATPQVGLSVAIGPIMPGIQVQVPISLYSFSETQTDLATSINVIMTLSVAFAAFI